MKHAVLVMAHGDMSILKKQMQLLDDERFDYFIHIDARNQNDGMELMNICRKSHVTCTKRIPVFWGHHSQTRAAMILLKESVKKDYDYYHLVSGVDMPLKTPKEIDTFCTENSGKEFVVIWKSDNWRMSHRYPFIVKYKRGNSEFVNKLKKGLISRVFRFPRKKGTNLVRDYGWTVYCGDAWWSITDALAKYLVSFEDEMLKYWTDCYIADECFAQTIIKNTPQFANRHSNMVTREIRWENATPHIWKVADIDFLKQSNALFARKFSTSEMEAVNQIFDIVFSRKQMQG